MGMHGAEIGCQLVGRHLGVRLTVTGAFPDQLLCALLLLKPSHSLEICGTYGWLHRQTYETNR